MGASNSKLDEDKELEFCRTRKKLIKQALNGRCSLAEAHLSYIEQLKIVGSAIRSFVETDDQIESPDSLTPVSHRFTEKSIYQSPQADATANILSSPSSTFSFEFKSHHVRFRSETSIILEEKLDSAVMEPSSANPPSTTPHWVDGLEESVPSESAPWDYFGLSHPVDNHISSEEKTKDANVSQNFDEMIHVSTDADVGESEEVEKKLSSEIEESQLSEDEFDEPPSSTLVRSFSNVNRTNEKASDSNPTVSNNNASESRSSGTENVTEAKENLVNGDSAIIRSPESMLSETKSANRNNQLSPDLSPLKGTPAAYLQLVDVDIKPMKHNEVEDNCVPKSFISSVKDIEQIFFRASEAGKEVPRKLEANKFHFRPVLSGRDSRSVIRLILKACLKCGKDPVEVPHVPPQNSVKYLRWHRTTSSSSASSRFLLGSNSNNYVDPGSSNLFENFCMTSGSHASTLDRLHAWEKKLYDEVKAARSLRSIFDQKCRILQQEESRGLIADKTRALVKDLHSRIGVAIHRLESIWKKIEEIRDSELQPQLEELIEGLRKMWETMMECHKLQFHIMSISYPPTGESNSDHRRQAAIHLVNELDSLHSTITEWMRSQNKYIENINEWLLKCVDIQESPNKRKKRTKTPPERKTHLIRKSGPPPIYIICDEWIIMMKSCSFQGVVKSIKDLVNEVSHFLPRQEKKTGANRLRNRSTSFSTVDEGVLSLDHFRMNLVTFLAQMGSFSEDCANMYANLQKAIQKAILDSIKEPPTNKVTSGSNIGPHV